METFVEVEAGRDASPIGRIMQVQRWLSEIVIVVMCLLVTAEVICRTFLGFSLLISDEVGGYLLVALVFLGIGCALHDGALFRVEFVLRALPRRGRQAVQLLFDILSLGFALLLTWQMYELVRESYASHVQAATTLATPQYIPQIVMVVGSFTMALVLIAKCAAGARVVFGSRP
jgi:TRAP-type C4-dicarboxylate transport system permease small subunit